MRVGRNTGCSAWNLAVIWTFVCLWLKQKKNEAMQEFTDVLRLIERAKVLERKLRKR